MGFYGAPPAWVQRYIGIPYADPGFDFSGCHCWGLVCLVYKHERGIELPKHDAITAKDLIGISRRIRDESTSGPWRRAISRTTFDVVIMKACHIGIAVGARYVLHIEPGSESTCVQRFHPAIAGRQVGQYRYEANNHSSGARRRHAANMA